VSSHERKCGRASISSRCWQLRKIVIWWGGIWRIRLERRHFWARRLVLIIRIGKAFLSLAFHEVSVVVVVVRIWDSNSLIDLFDQHLRLHLTDGRHRFRVESGRERIERRWENVHNICVQKTRRSIENYQSYTPNKYLCLCPSCYIVICWSELASLYMNLVFDTFEVMGIRSENRISGMCI